MPRRFSFPLNASGLQKCMVEADGSTRYQQYSLVINGRTDSGLVMARDACEDLKVRSYLMRRMVWWRFRASVSIPG